MADRIFGPNRGAGTQVREREPEKNIVPGMLGSTVFVGVAERGKEDDITLVPSDKARRRKLGGLLDPADFNPCAFASLEGPLAARHFYEHSDGAGYLVFLRVVPKTNDVTNDDRPDKARLLVFNREDTPRYIGYIDAHNGGRWAGQREQFLGTITGVPGTDFPLDNQVLFDGMSAKDWKRDEWKGATLHIHGIVDRTYQVVSNNSAGLLTFAADEDIPADWAGAGPPVDLNVTLYRDNLNYRGQEKRLSVKFKDGGLDPVAYFGMEVYVDGDLLLGDYENLSMDTASPLYWVDVINNDPNNDLIRVTDSFTGNRLAATSRPANRYGLSDTLTTTTLTLDEPFIYNVSSVGAWVPGYTFTSYGTSVLPQLIAVECTDATAGAEVFDVTTDIGNRTYTVTGDLAAVGGIPVVTDQYMIDFAISTGTGVLGVGDIFYIYVRVLYEDELIGGKVVPDVTDTKVYTIVDNTRTAVLVTATSDLTDGGSLVGGEQFRLEWPERMGGGYDGYIAGMSSTDYEPIFDNATSKLLKLKYMNLGLVKVGVPGIAKPTAAVTLQKKVRDDLCLAYNWHYRVEIPDEIETEEDALAWINNTYGRLDLVTTFFPCFNMIRDPFAPSGSAARPYEISMTGMHLGREAKIANDWGGYHKAEAGVEVTFPLILDSTVLGRPDEPVRLNEELLNPAGINVYRWKGDGTMIAWGDRTLDPTTAFRFKHKREQLSHYTNVMRENFDWAIFQINDPIADADVLAALHEYYLAEYRKRALRGDSFTGGRNPAAIIKMDASNNTNATRAQGDQNVDISLRFADVVERLKISIGAMGIMEVG